MFAALNTIEPPIVFLNQLQRMDSPEARSVQGPVIAAIQGRLDRLAKYLGDRDYLEDEFNAGDLLMTSVLRILRTTDLVRALPILQRYQERCEARPAFKRALGSHTAAFEANKPS
jgi:glutathione S-transferase